MKGNIKKFVASGSLTITGLFLSFAVFAESIPLDPPITATDFKSFFISIAAGVAAIIGPAAILMVVVAGILFITSAGDPGRINTAKTCLIYAIIGGIIAGSATIIVNTFLP